MITVRFHKALLDFTEGHKEITIERDSYFFILLNCANLFPELERLIKKQISSPRDDLAIVFNGKIISGEEFLLQPPEGSTIVIVPIFLGGDPITFAFVSSFALSTLMSLAQGYSFGNALLRGLISGVFAAAGAFIGIQIFGAAAGGLGVSIGKGIVSGVFNVLGSIVANAVTGPPPRQVEASADDANKAQNDTFGSIVNTTEQGVAVSLNYGLIRVGGQIISSDIETLTDQRVPDPVSDSQFDSISYNAGTGGYGEGYGSFGNDRDFAGTAGTLGYTSSSSTIGGIDRSGGGIGEYGDNSPSTNQGDSGNVDPGQGPPGSPGSDF